MDFILGTARFVAPRAVEIRTRTGHTRRIRGTDFVNTAPTAPAAPALPAIGQPAVWTSETSIVKIGLLSTCPMGRGGESPPGEVERDVPPVIAPDARGEPDLADDLAEAV